MSKTARTGCRTSAGCTGGAGGTTIGIAVAVGIAIAVDGCLPCPACPKRGSTAEAETWAEGVFLARLLASFLA